MNNDILIYNIFIYVIIEDEIVQYLLKPEKNMYLINFFEFDLNFLPQRCLAYLLLPVFPSLGLSFPVCALLCHLLVSTSLPQTLSQTHHRPSFGTHQSRHLLVSTTLPPTLSSYPPTFYFFYT